MKLNEFIGKFVNSQNPEKQTGKLPLENLIKDIKNKFLANVDETQNPVEDNSPIPIAIAEYKTPKGQAQEEIASLIAHYPDNQKNLVKKILKIKKLNKLSDEELRSAILHRMDNNFYQNIRIANKVKPYINELNLNESIIKQDAKATILRSLEQGRLCVAFHIFNTSKHYFLDESDFDEEYMDKVFSALENIINNENIFLDYVNLYYYIEIKKHLKRDFSNETKKKIASLTSNAILRKLNHDLNISETLNILNHTEEYLNEYLSESDKKQIGLGVQNCLLILSGRLEYQRENYFRDLLISIRENKEKLFLTEEDIENTLKKSLRQPMVHKKLMASKEVIGYDKIDNDKALKQEISNAALKMIEMELKDPKFNTFDGFQGFYNHPNGKFEEAYIIGRNLSKYYLTEKQFQDSIVNIIDQLFETGSIYQIDKIVRTELSVVNLLPPIIGFRIQAKLQNAINNYKQ